MAKILSTESIKGPLVKLFELPNHYVINGQIYNKSNLSPLPMQFAFYTSSTANEMVLDKTVYYKTGHTTAYSNDRTSLIDGKNPNIIYSIRTSIVADSGSNFTLDVFKTDLTDDAPLISRYSVVFTANFRAAFADEDDDFLYLYAQITGVDTRILKINKSTMTLASPYNIAINRRVEVIKTTDLYIYFAVNGITNVMQVLKYTKSNASVTILKDDTGLAGGFSAQSSIAVDPDNDNIFYIIRDGWMQDSIHRAIVKKYTINVDTDSVDIAYVDMKLDKYTKGGLIEYYNNIGNQNDLEIISSNGKKYLIMTRYGEANNSDNSFMLVFEFTTSESIKLTQEVNFNNALFNMVLFFNENRNLIVANGEMIRFYVWNAGSERFELTSANAKSIQMIGVDMDENVFVQLADTSIEIISNTITNSIVTKLENELYEYYGEDISSNLIAYAQNFAGEFISTDINLTIIGPAKFTTSGTKKITISTSNISANVIPITIIGSGKIKALSELA